MASHSYHKKSYKNDGATIIETVFVGLLKAIWWLVTLPFKKGKKGRAKISNTDIEQVRIKKREISNILQSENVYELKHALMEADKLFDHMLKLKGYSGETFADRLRSAEPYMDANSYQSIWEGHKIRNAVAHSQDDISIPYIKSAINKLLDQIRV